MKKTAIISLLALGGAVLILSSCGVEKSQPEASKYTTRSATVFVPTTEAIASQDELEDILAKKTSDAILNFCYDDFDGNGSYEAFAFVGKPDTDDSPAAQGDIWFVTENGAKKLPAGNNAVGNDYWQTGTVIDMDTRKYFAIDNYRTTSGVSLVWYVKNGEAVESEISGKIENLRLNKPGELIGQQSAYDAGSIEGTLTGHTWKEYYFYENDDIKEYGGKEISRAELLSFDGTTEIVNAIEKKGYKISDIIYRANDIININFSMTDGTDKTFQNTTLRITDNKAEIIIGDSAAGYEYDYPDFLASSYGGTFKLAAIPEIAVYPD